MTFPRVLLLLSAATFTVFGAWGFVAPESQVSIVEVSVPTATARADVRAQYGGFTLGMGVFLFVCATRREWISPGLLGSGCTLTGFVLARVLSVITDDSVARAIYYLIASEGTGAVLSFVGWYYQSKVNRS